MKLHSATFEHRLWRRLRRARRSAGKARPRARRGAIPGAEALPETGFFGVALLTGFAAFGPFFSRPRGWTREAVFALCGVFFTWLILITRMVPRSAISSGRDLGPLFWLPASDDLIFAWGWRRLTAVKWLFVSSFASVLALFFLKPDFSPLNFLKIAAVAVVSAFAAAALSIAPPRFKTRYLILAGGIVLMLLHVPVIAPVLRTFFIEHGSELNWLHPGGWIAMMAEALLHPGTPGPGALLVVPLALIAATWPYSRRYWREQFDSGLQLASWQRPAALRTGQALPEPLDLPEDAEAADAETAGSIRADVESVLRAPIPARGPGWFDRLLGPTLTQREAWLVRFLRAQRPPLATQATRCSAWLAGAWALGWLLNTSGRPTLAAFVVVSFAPVFVFIHLLQTAPTPKVGIFAKFFPIGYGEAARLNARMRWRTLLVLSLPLACYCSAAAWLIGAPWLLGAFTAAKGLIFLATLQPLIIARQFAIGTRAGMDFRWRSALVVLVQLIGAASAVAGAIAIPLPFAQTLLVYPVVALLNLGVSSAYRQAWSRRWFDLAPPPGKSWQ